MAKARIEPVGWHRGMNYLEERKILDGMLDKIEAIEKKIFFKDKIVWLPEYDDMMLTYLPPEEIKKYEAEGKNRKEILNIAEDKIAEASWNANKDVNMGSFWASRDKNRQNEVFMASAARVPVELEVHPGIVDRADHVRPPLVDGPLHRPLHAEEVEQPAQDRPEAHHGQVVRLEAVVRVAAYLVAGQKLAKPVCVDEPRRPRPQEEESS